MFVHLLTLSCIVQNGYTALIVAADKGHLRVVELLIASKAEVNIQANVSHMMVFVYLLAVWLSVCTDCHFC